MRTNRPPIIISVALLAIGAALLLRNFLLIDSSGFDLLRLWPVVLIAAGVQVLWRGDLGFTWQAQTFGITRGNVQAATLQIESGEIDVKIRALRREGRLIAGQYAARSRPGLVVRGGQAQLTMQRGQSWLLSLADWEIGLARDLPWQGLASAWLGDLDADLRGLHVERLYLGSGLGDVQIVASDIPQNTETALYGRSTFGNVTLIVPADVPAAVRIEVGALARVQIDETRFLRREPGVYATLDYDTQVEAGAQPVTAHLHSVFGTVRLV